MGMGIYMKPATEYTKSGCINIAYQVFGSGTTDLIYIPGWVSNIDWMWACPELVNFFQELGKHCRIILFDKRGTGLSDRITELSTLEERMDDIRAVMDAVDSKKAILFGHSEGGCVSALFTATYPERVISFIAFGIFAKRRYAPDYPWAPTDEELQQVYDLIENNWGSGEMNLASLAPSKANDPVFMEWLANYLRSGASPGAALVLAKMNTEVDIIDILSSIHVPTLILQRTQDVDVNIEEGRFIASRIKGAKYVEFQGSDHLFWVGNTEEILHEMTAFISEVKPTNQYEKRLMTIVLARVIHSQDEDGNFQDLISENVEKYQGKMIHCQDGLFIATFDGPSRAVHCSLDVTEAAEAMNTQVALGVHIKECLTSTPISAQTVDIVASLLQHGRPNEVLITETVKRLISGSGLNFTMYKTIHEPYYDESFALFCVKDDSRIKNELNMLSEKKAATHDTFLKNVLACIDLNLAEEAFGVDVLSREIGMSERQLQRKLKSITNKSPSQLIIYMRLYRAKELLLSDQNNISEVSFKTGFSDTSYFSKCFKKEFGLSPSHFKNHN